MKSLKYLLPFAILPYIGLSHAYAEEDVIQLPTIYVMAEDELSEEQVGFVPFQENQQTRQALQRHIDKSQTDLQNTKVNEQTAQIMDVQAAATAPELSKVAPALQRHILSVAEGFHSSDPTNGAFKMLEPLGLNRDNIQGIREEGMKVKMEDLIKLQNMLQQSLKIQ